MDLPIRWLGDYVDIGGISIEKFVADMTMSGSKAEGWKRAGADIQGVVTGRIETIEKHENSDHLWVCAVDIGGQNRLQIVTGADNVGEGDIVPVAQDGAKLPGGKEIRAGELRGIMSEGMLCSHQELGLTVNYCPGAPEHGILILGADTPLGQDIRETLMLSDDIVEFEITPNRPDCLSVIGLAREVSATFGRPLSLKPPRVVGGSGDIGELLSIRVDDPDLCPVYSARMVKNIKIAPSPLWMRARLQAAGVRPINNIVDITNFVMLEYGNPMHAFDYNCLGGENIIVRRARTGEHFTTLDGREHDLEDGMLVIADRERPVGLAGIMGGLNSEITPDTDMVVFESANFSGPSIRATSRRLGMRTDASSRFEKGLDAALTIPALERACELVEMLGAGEVVGGRVHIGNPPERRVIALECDRINALLGLSLSCGEIAGLLASLGFEEQDGGVAVPTWRGDAEGIADLAEEVARLYGYNKIPSTLFRGAASEGGLSEKQRILREINRVCRGLGYSEIVTYSFVSPKCYDDIAIPADSPLRRSVTILNPLGEDTSVMRTTALPSMLQILAGNYNHRSMSARLYEVATIYLPALDGAGSVEPAKLPEERGLLMLGEYGKDSDFYSLKGSVEALLGFLRLDGIEFAPERNNPAYHPGKTAKIYYNSVCLGLLGEVHPSVAERYGLSIPVYTAELDIPAILGSMEGDPVYTPLPRFPATTRDLAMVCDESVLSGDVVRLIKENSKYLQSVELFDIYRGAQIAEGKKSMAYSLVFRDNEKTMTDETADQIMAKIVSALEKAFSASLR